MASRSGSKIGSQKGKLQNQPCVTGGVLINGSASGKNPAQDMIIKEEYDHHTVISQKSTYSYSDPSEKEWSKVNYGQPYGVKTVKIEERRTYVQNEYVFPGKQPAMPNNQWRGDEDYYGGAPGAREREAKEYYQELENREKYIDYDHFDHNDDDY